MNVLPSVWRMLETKETKRADLLIAVAQLCLWEWVAEASRGERYLEVSYELPVHPRHSQRNLTF
jgi:hypothetical protein